MGFWDFLKGGDEKELPTLHRAEETPEALGYTAAQAGPSVTPRAPTYLMASELLSDEEWSPRVEARMADIGVSEDMIPALRSLMTTAGGAAGATMGEGQARYGAEEGGLMGQLMQILGLAQGSPGQMPGAGPGGAINKPPKLQYSLINPTPRYSPRAAEKGARPFGSYPGAFSWAQYLQSSQRGQQERLPQLTKFY